MLEVQSTVHRLDKRPHQGSPGQLRESWVSTSVHLAGDGEGKVGGQEEVS